ncbi:MAG: cytochrome c, partial [Verrucomicrobiota bacterium]
MKLLLLPLLTASLAVLCLPRVAQSAEVTFSEHISPILYNNCTVCHREGEIGPFPLTSYEEAAAYAESILDVIEDDTMPPWPPDRAFSRLVGERGLTDEQDQLITDWVLAGAPQGDPEKEAPLPDFPEGSVLGEPDLT